jgi:prolyl-tRNA synthetase
MTEKSKDNEKFENFTEWYEKVILEAHIADDRYPVKGFTVYMGWGYSIAKRVYQMLEAKLEETDHQPMQFPVVIPEEAFKREADHIEGFGAEVFWITRAGNNKLERRLLLRPTSETAIYPMFNIWIRSHADLPLRMHQTCNVYRYETKATRPLFRGREFLWNEAHTAHVDFEDAERQVKVGVEAYRHVYDALGLAYIILKRPDFDKFAGAVYSLAFDAWNPDGRVNQIGTIHQLGDNFAKAFELTYEDEEGNQSSAHNTCYGMGIGRTVAATLTHHGDDNGLVLPPVIAPRQAVIVPIPFKGRGEDVYSYAKEVTVKLSEAGIRVKMDDDNRLRPGEKYYKWEMFGVPVRVELGPREADSKTVTLVRRDTGEKSKVQLDSLQSEIVSLFDDIQANLKARSWEQMNEALSDAVSIEELKDLMEKKKIVRVNWCGDAHCAFLLKDEVAGDVRGTLWGEQEVPTGPCIVCGDESKYIAYIARSF